MDNSEMCHIERAGWKTQLMLFLVERNERERERERERVKFTTGGLDSVRGRLTLGFCPEAAPPNEVRPE